MVLKSHVKLCETAGFSAKIFWPQNWENGAKMGQKHGFFNLLENLVTNVY